MSLAVLRGLQRQRNLAIICKTCRQGIKVGDLVVSKHASSSRGKVRLRHYFCAKRINLV